ncbi:MAG TPA: hypothetical protein VH912_08915 [Streptosporangiaceae bacterium]|jgi:hypothetical protein
MCWPAPADDPWHERLVHANLSCLWSNFAAAGAERLVLCRVLEASSLLRHVRAAVPGADITVVPLRVPLEEVHARIGRREAGDPAWYLNAATRLMPIMERRDLADHVVDNTGRPARTVAADVLRLAGWLP